jgi:hypothetical protein
MHLEEGIASHGVVANCDIALPTGTPELLPSSFGRSTEAGRGIMKEEVFRIIVVDNQPPGISTVVCRSRIREKNAWSNLPEHYVRSYRLAWRSGCLAFSRHCRTITSPSARVQCWMAPMILCHTGFL